MVLFFRGQRLSSGRQREFSRVWGELETNPSWSLVAGWVVGFGRRVVSVSGFEIVWHVVVAFRERRPGMGVVLRLGVVPSFGGDTLWADMAAACDNLPDGVRARVDGVVVEHVFVPGFRCLFGVRRLARRQDVFPAGGSSCRTAVSGDRTAGVVCGHVVHYLDPRVRTGRE
ncbi:TauD/TfdA dioxygenase family protein [Streptomyces sp. V3I7]|uniref:TauD/TfdA dioxygenase family protein n=1 Tax=Streptomyces sp. V3I7 TaxID=3042278 RepID=UPI00359420AB